MSPWFLSLVWLLSAPALASETGKLIVMSTTRGADIFVDGDRVSSVPAKKPILLEPGIHTVRVQLRGYATFEDRVRIAAGQETFFEADLLAVGGILIVETPGVVAQVLVDNERIGKTPFDGEIRIGQRIVTIAAAGYEPYRKTMTVRGGELYPLTVDLFALSPAFRDTPDPLPDAPTALEEISPPPDPHAWRVRWDDPWILWAGGGVATATLAAVIWAALAEEEVAPPAANATISLEGNGFR